MVQRRNWTNQDPGFGDAYKQSNSDFSEDFWLKLWLEHNSKLQEAQIKRKLAEQKPGLLKDPYKVGKLDSSIEIPQRAQKEAASAMRRSEKAKKSEYQFLLREKVSSAAKSLAFIKRDLKWNKILVNWIEQQNLVIASRHATSIHNTGGNNNQGLVKKSRS